MTYPFIFSLLFALTTNVHADASDVDYNDAKYCSNYFAKHGDVSLPPDSQRRCMIAIASTYVNGEENTTPMGDMLLSDDISRHNLGTLPNHQAGAAEKIKNGTGTSVIAAINNRQWSVDGNQAWIVYDGYLKSDRTQPSFYVAERFTIKNGLIREILLAPVVHTIQR